MQFTYSGHTRFRVAIAPRKAATCTLSHLDAISAASMVQCISEFGVHYDRFGYITIDREKALADFSRNGLELLLPGINETIKIN
jgi:hypothetical protein